MNRLNFVGRDLKTFKLSPNDLKLLNEAGFHTSEHLVGVRAMDLAKELKISKEKAQEILETISRNSSKGKKKEMEPKTAYELLEEDLRKNKICTLCREIDEMLGGGVSISQVTEFCGYPGIGNSLTNLFLPRN